MFLEVLRVLCYATVERGDEDGKKKEKNTLDKVYFRDTDSCDPGGGAFCSVKIYEAWARKPGYGECGKE